MAYIAHVQARDGDGKVVPGLFAPAQTLVAPIKGADQASIFKGVDVKNDTIIRFVSDADIVLTVKFRGNAASVPMFAGQPEQFLIRKGSDVTARALTKEGKGEVWATIMR